MFSAPISLALLSFKDNAEFFSHEKRVVWSQRTALGDGLFLYLYLDEALRNKEESDYVLRITTHPESHSRENYLKKKRNRFSTLALLTGLDRPESTVYQTYKNRMAIEVMFDGIKNVLNADHTYTQNEQTLQGWMFINHITLQWYQHLYIELKEKELLKIFSVNDYVKLLCGVKKIKINDA
ncbi:transposase [Pleomorphovibrio marinus]|uniref:transposase n=1 Tax=Pleomorphovibrio marinus TaxID=2164132 RepID=UPI000E0C1CD9|nr:transposase [Pleomorphovibrio marinus]